MKKSFLFTLLATIAGSTMAQNKSPYSADSILKNKLNYKIDTSLFSNKAITSQLLKGNNLAAVPLSKIQPFPLAMANNVERLTYSKVDHMPILNTSGKSKMAVIKPQGNSKMPVVGKGTGDNETVIIDRRP